MVTETDDLALALDAAARKWPELRSRRELLLRMVERAHQQLRDDEAEWLADRRRAIEETAGSLSGMYPPGYLEELRKDWPE